MELRGGFHGVPDNVGGPPSVEVGNVPAPVCIPQVALDSLLRTIPTGSTLTQEVIVRSIIDSPLG